MKEFDILTKDINKSQICVARFIPKQRIPFREWKGEFKLIGILITKAGVYGGITGSIYISDNKEDLYDRPKVVIEMSNGSNYEFKFSEISEAEKFHIYILSFINP